MRFLATTVALAAASLFLAAPAGAASTVACDVHAHATFTPGIVLFGGSGTYTLATFPDATTQCSVDGGAPQQSKLATSGVYTSVVCATMTMRSGNGTGVTTLDVGATRVISSADYTVDVRAGEGDVQIDSVNGRSDSLRENGVLTMVPTQGSCLTGVTDAEVFGTIVADWGLVR